MTDIPSKPADCVTDNLVVRARIDREALGELYDMTYRPVFRYCLRRSGNRGLAEDVTSTVFLNIAGNIASFQGTTFQEFRRWVFTIATNEINSDCRKTARRRVLLEDAANSGQLRGHACGEGIDENRECDMLQAALLKLSDRAQAIIALRFFSGLSYEDIALVLSISPGTARTAASRVLQEIRGDLEPYSES